MYQTTPLEDYVHDLYTELSIQQPHELDLITIASKLHIWIYFQKMSSKAIERNGLYSMVIDKRLPPAEQWQEFAHELCHLLRHAGNQIQTNTAFVSYQELQAEQFALYFCVPTFMLKRITFPTDPNELITLVSDTFNVTHEFALQRLHLHYRKVQAALINERLREKYVLHRIQGIEE